MRIYHDWEFLERGPEFPIIPISVGMVKENGDELYYVFEEAPWDIIAEHEWLTENVVPFLGSRLFYRSTEFIRREVDLFLSLASATSRPDKIELWGWYSAYDHVCLAQLFGKMVDLPSYMPKWTNDIRQEAHRMNICIPKIDLYDAEEKVHNALDDAVAEKRMHEWLIEEVTFNSNRRSSA